MEFEMDLECKTCKEKKSINEIYIAEDKINELVDEINKLILLNSERNKE